MSPRSCEGGYPPSLRLLLRGGVPPLSAKSHCDCCCGGGFPPSELQNRHCCGAGGYPPSRQSRPLLRPRVTSYSHKHPCGWYCGEGGYPPSRQKATAAALGGTPPQPDTLDCCCCCAPWYPLRVKNEAHWGTCIHSFSMLCCSKADQNSREPPPSVHWWLPEVHGHW